MHGELIAAEDFIYRLLGFAISEFKNEEESQEYAASTFKLGTLSIKFRAAKITPTKTGQFVTLWKRDEKGITCPHDLSDLFDLYVISVRDQTHSGQFIFPKSALIKQGILSTNKKEGKRGFRVYPPWDITDNKQAQKTQKWQLEFFLEINEGASLDVEKAKSLYAE